MRITPWRNLRQLTEQSLAGLVRLGELVEAEGPAVHRAASIGKIADGKRLLYPQLRPFQKCGQQLRGISRLIRLLGIGDKVHPDLLAELLVVGFPGQLDKAAALVFRAVAACAVAQTPAEI